MANPTLGIPLTPAMRALLAELTEETAETLTSAQTYADAAAAEEATAAVEASAIAVNTIIASQVFG